MWRGGRRRGTDPYAVLLLVQLGQQIAQLERKPPVTLAVIAGMHVRCRDAGSASLKLLLTYILAV